MGNDEVNYVSEDLFREKTGNISSAVEALTKRVEKVIDDHEERLRNHQSQIQNAKEGVLENAAYAERVCDRLEEHEGQTEQQHRDDTLRVAKLALRTSIISVAGVLLIAVSTLILKLTNVI